MITIIPNYHPLLVHFTVALITTSLGMLLLGGLLTWTSWQRLRDECFIVSRWCLWLGALATIFTVIAGFHAYYTVTHDMPSHYVMSIHRNWGLTTLVIFLLTAILSIIRYRQQKPMGRLLVTGIILIFLLVTVTAWYGGELVYRHGVGVMSLPNPHSEDHNHNQGEHYH